MAREGGNEATTMGYWPMSILSLDRPLGFLFLARELFQGTYGMLGMEISPVPSLPIFPPEHLPQTVRCGVVSPMLTMFADGVGSQESIVAI